MKIVCTKQHLFNRWDESSTGYRINFEGTNPRGCSWHPDDYYGINWKYPITEAFAMDYGYLLSMTPRQEFAYFMGNRGYFSWDVGRYRDAFDALIVANGHYPETNVWIDSLASLLMPWERSFDSRLPRGFPKIRLEWDGQRHWQALTAFNERRAHQLIALETILNDSMNERNWWRPLREGRQPLTRLPKLVTYRPSRSSPCTTPEPVNG